MKCIQRSTAWKCQQNDTPTTTFLTTTAHPYFLEIFGQETSLLNPINLHILKVTTDLFVLFTK